MLKVGKQYKATNGVTEATFNVLDEFDDHYLMHLVTTDNPELVGKPGSRIQVWKNSQIIRRYHWFEVDTPDVNTDTEEVEDLIQFVTINYEIDRALMEGNKERFMYLTNLLKGMNRNEYVS